jgi:Protein of unknown function (DUF3106)
LAEAFRAIIIGLALTIAIALLPAPAHSQVIRNGPNWSELSAQDRQVLAPLASDWDKLDLLRKNKWLAMAKRYPTLPAAEQQRIHERMPGWAKLSSQERQAAREKFKGLKQLPAEQRKELPNKWMEYQSLPQEQRQELRRAPTGQRGTSGGDASPARPTPAPAPPATR